ncbi:MAG: LysM peptidoglycan-binding domain-containing protein [Caldilineaceae bacterium]|nr:LysM peptidoglycan-binding domain-containing protein [Caldilineaceae bacterium]
MQETIAHALQQLQRGRVFSWWTTRPLRIRRSINVSLVVMVVMSAVVAASPGHLAASYVNVLENGDFERGFGNQPGCGMVGAGWQCFTNGGGANYGFYDDQWTSTVADGSHSQLIEINTKGISAPEHDRYAGIFQTVAVVDWAEYTLNLKGMIRTTSLDGDPWRYRVEVGWTNGHYADWSKVTNWTDVGWDSYYPREAPGGFSAYATKITAQDKYLTVYVRVWKKWGIGEEELNVNFDTITLTGPSPYTQHDGKPTYGPGPAPDAPAVGQPQPAPAAGGSCSMQELIYNGGFEQGFNAVAGGHVGKSWGYFTNGGAANYGFYDDQWSPVIAEGSHAQLIEINSKGIYPADADRYAGIYQRIGWLQPGQSYELTIKGILRGVGNEDDPYRFEAQWGYLPGHNTDWGQVSNWTTVDFGEIQSRTSPSGIRTYTVRFTPQTSEITLFIRGWKKWGVSEVEMDLNLDAISLRGCISDKPAQPSGPKPGPGGSACLYIVQPGDILGWVAQRYGVSIYDLMAANGISNANLIYVGQQLNIPGCAAVAPVQPIDPDKPAVVKPVAPAPAARTHTVAPGETLSYICNLYGVDVNTLAAANNIANVNFIYVGQQLIIP